MRRVIEIFVIVIIVSLIVKGYSTYFEEPREQQILSTSQTATKSAITTIASQEFGALSEHKQKDIVENGHFFSCNQVDAYCKTHPESEGCRKYCD